MGTLSLPFWPGPGVASGKAATSLGEKNSYEASGHILNSSIVHQEEMCLVNVAVTALKHPNLIPTTSLRRHRSDKHKELRRDEAGTCLLCWDTTTPAQPFTTLSRDLQHPSLEPSEGMGAKKSLWAPTTASSGLVHTHTRCHPNAILPQSIGAFAKITPGTKTSL